MAEDTQQEDISQTEETVPWKKTRTESNETKLDTEDGTAIGFQSRRKKGI